MELEEILSSGYKVSCQEDLNEFYLMVNKVIQVQFRLGPTGLSIGATSLLVLYK